MIEKFITLKAKESKTRKSSSVTGGGGIKRKSSLLSMENLDVEYDENSEESNAACSDDNT